MNNNIRIIIISLLIFLLVLWNLINKFNQLGILNKKLEANIQSKEKMIYECIVDVRKKYLKTHTAVLDGPVGVVKHFFQRGLQAVAPWAAQRTESAASSDLRPGRCTHGPQLCRFLVGEDRLIQPI